MSLYTRFTKLFADEAEPEAKPIMGEVGIADLFTASAYVKHGAVTVYNPSELITRRGYTTIDKMRLDEQIKAAMTFKKQAINSSGWEIVSPSDQAQDWEVTEFVRETLSNTTTSLNEVIREMLLALDYGFSITEKIYEKRDGKIVIADFKTRRPHNMYFELDAHGNVMGLRQFNTQLPIDKFVLYTHDREFQNPYGVTDLSAAYRAWWSKDNAYKWLAILLERMGIPPIFFFYNTSSQTGNSLNELQTILKRLQSATVATIPRGNKDDIEPWTPELAGAASTVFIPAIGMYDQHITKGLLMPGLLGFSSDGEVGSLARSKTQFDSFMLVVDATRGAVSRNAIQNQVVKPLVDLNYPGITKYPEFRFLPIDKETQTGLYELWGKLVAGKVVKNTDDDEIHLRSSLKFPEREYVEGEREEMNTPPAPVVPPTGFPPSQKFTRRKDMALEKVSKDSREIAAKMSAIEEDLKNKLAGLVTASRERITKWVEKNYGAEDFDASAYSNPASFGAFEAVRASLSEGSEFGGEMARKMVAKAKTFAKPTRPMGLPGESTKRAIKYLKQKARVVADKFDQKVQDDVRLALLTGLKTGDSVNEVMTRVNAALDSVDDVYAENVVRTNLTEAVNLGILSELRSPDLAPFVAAVKSSSILDERTTEVCSFLDGKLFKPGDSALDELSPPSHFQCRRLLVPVLIDEQPEEDEFITEAEKGQARELTAVGFL